MDSLFQSEVFSSSSWSYESLKNFGPITTSVQNHLKLVYLTLCLAVAASAGGAYLHILYNIGGAITAISSLAPVTWILLTPASDLRFNLLLATSLLQGATIGALIGLVLDINPRTIVTALIGSGFAFGCFSATAMVAKRRQLLFLGGLLSSGLTILLWLHLTSSIFGGSTAHFNAEIYFGLLLFLGYIVFDTQLMIERAASGGRDYILDCLLLFVDFCGVFIRMITNLVNNATERDRRRKR
ncbi:bax inhibitor 1-like isoform X3 [Wolffia australiana]